MPIERQTIDALLRRLLEGESLRSVCRDPAMPGLSTFFRALADDPQLAREYSVATELRSHLMFEDAIHIADESAEDWIEREGEGGVVERVPNLEHIARSRLRVDTRKWAAAKMNPRKYGDRLDVEVTTPLDRAALLAAARKRVLNGGNLAADPPLLPALASARDN